MTTIPARPGEPAAPDVPTDGACCAACAVQASDPGVSANAARTQDRTPAASPGRVLPVMDGPAPRVAISRDTDRRVTLVGLLVAAAFLGAALLGLAHLVLARTGPWIPVHLALAGGASTAVAAVLPFFSAALSAARPVDPRIRGVGVGAVAGGALLVSLAVPTGLTTLAVAGGLGYVLGMGAVAVAALRPLRGALGVRRPIVERAYALALAQVGLGVLLAVGMVAGLSPIVERWGLLKPAHAWLNLFGFLTVVIAATLVHLAPTVAGGRIRARRSARIAVACLAVGPLLAAAGLGIAVDLIVRAGATLELIGAMALIVHAEAVQRDHGRWSTDREWHRLTSWSLRLAPVWLLVAVALAAGPLLWLGADPGAWSIERVAAPLAIGFVGQVLVGSWSHLVPAIGPGDQATHARQRAWLGRFAMARLVLLDAGVALATLGALGIGDAPARDGPLLGAGLVMAASSLGLSIALLAAAAGDRRRPSPSLHPF